MHRVTERALKIYKYTPVSPIIKALEGGKKWSDKYLSSPNCKLETLTGTQLRNKGEVKGDTQQKGRQKGRPELGRLEPALSRWPSFPPHLSGTSWGLCLSRDPHPLLREMNLPLRKAKPASRGNVQNRKWKMSTSSKPTSKGKTSCQFGRLAALTGFQITLCPCLPLCLSHPVSLNNISFLINSNLKYLLHLSLC